MQCSFVCVFVNWRSITYHPVLNQCKYRWCCFRLWLAKWSAKSINFTLASIVLLNSKPSALVVILNLNSFRPKALIDIRRNKSYSHIKGSIYIRAALKLRPNDISSTRRRVLKKRSVEIYTYHSRSVLPLRLVRSRAFAAEVKYHFFVLITKEWRWGGCVVMLWAWGIRRTVAHVRRAWYLP